MILRIRDWDFHFENSSSRKLKRLDWVAIPNKTDGEGYTALVDHPNAAAHLGAWYAIVEAASKQAPRGTLPGGISHDVGGISRSLGRMSRLPAKVFEEVLPRLIEIGWLENVDVAKPQSNQQNVHDLLAESASTVAESASTVADSGRKVAAHYRELQGTTGKGREQNRNACANGIELHGCPSGRFEDWWAIWSRTRTTNHRMSAEQVYVRCVTTASEIACFECTASYCAGIEPSKGYNPENFLLEQAKDLFQARWPARASPNGKVASSSVMQRERKEPSIEQMAAAHRHQAKSDLDPKAREYSVKWLTEHNLEVG